MTKETIWDDRYQRTSLDLRVVWELAYHVRHMEHEKLGALGWYISDYKGYANGLIDTILTLQKEKGYLTEHHLRIKKFLEEGDQIATKARELLSEFEIELTRIKKVLDFLLNEIGEKVE